MRPVIVSVKHYVQFTNALVTSGGVSVNVLANAVVNTALPATTADVKEGSIVKAIFIEMWLKGIGASDADTQFNMAVYKNPNGGSVMTAANLNNLMAYQNKKNVLYATQGVIGGVGGGQSVAVLRQWIKIPKGKQRMGLDDSFELAVTATGESIQRCGLVVFKEYQ